MSGPTTPSTAIQFPLARPSGATGQRFNKACDSCHVSKVRCVPELSSPDGACKRCAKNATQCAFSPLGPRRRPVRNKNDRIVELEKRVRDMQLALGKQVESYEKSQAAEGESAAGSSSQTSPAPSMAQARVEMLWPPSAQPKPLAATSPARISEDVVDRGVLTAADADALLEQFRAKLEGQFLGICLPKGFTNAELRRSRPATWLSVMCAASVGSSTHAELAPTLFDEMKKMLDDLIVPNAEPDLDILQALHTYLFWYFEPAAPRKNEMLSYYGVAIAMIVKVAESSDLHHLPEQIPIIEEMVDEAARELSRELLVWYWGSFVLTMKVRQPMPLHHIDLVKASLRILQTSHCRHDRCLVQWTKLAHSTSDTGTLLFRGHTLQPNGLSDEGRDAIIKSHEVKMKQWLVTCPFDLVNDLLMVEYHSYFLIISEVILPAGKFSNDDFTRRITGLPSLTVHIDEIPPERRYLAPFKLDYTRKCVKAAHAVLAIITNMESEYVRQLGTMTYGRVFYALRFLLLVGHNIWVTHTYDLIDIDSLKLGFYVDALARTLDGASGGGRFKVPSLWLYAINSRIKPWYEKFWAELEISRPSRPSHKTETETNCDTNLMPPPTTTSRTREQLPPANTANSEVAPERSHNLDAKSPIPNAPIPMAFPFEALSPMFAHLANTPSNIFDPGTAFTADVMNHNHHHQQSQLPNPDFNPEPAPAPVPVPSSAPASNSNNLDAIMNTNFDEFDFDFTTFYNILSGDGRDWPMSTLSPLWNGDPGNPPPAGGNDSSRLESS